MIEPQVPDVPGADSVVSWFGRWPSFHDAEVLYLHLNRAGASRLSIHAWNIRAGPPETDVQGFLLTDKHAVITFELEAISDLELADFSPQNVLASVEVQRDGATTRLMLHPLYGLGGRIDAARVKVSVTPGKPSTE